MHDPGKHNSPVRLPFGSFPVINILLSHTDIFVQTNRAACTLFRLLSCVVGKLCQPGKYQTMIVNRITIRNADHVYTIFFQRSFLSVLASLIYLCNRLFFDYTTKVHNILYYAIAVHIFLYLFNCYLLFRLK